MKTFFLLAFLLGSSASEASWAVPDDGPVSTVRYHDLDLKTPGGRAALQARVRRAARNVCDEPGPRTTENYERVKECISRTSQDAARQIP